MTKVAVTEIIFINFQQTSLVFVVLLIDFDNVLGGWASFKVHLFYKNQQNFDQVQCSSFLKAFNFKKFLFCSYFLSNILTFSQQKLLRTWQKLLVYGIRAKLVSTWEQNMLHTKSQKTLCKKGISIYYIVNVYFTDQNMMQMEDPMEFNFEGLEMQRYQNRPMGRA